MKFMNKQEAIELAQTIQQETGGGVTTEVFPATRLHFNKQSNPPGCHLVKATWYGKDFGEGYGQIVTFVQSDEHWNIIKPGKK